MAILLNAIGKGCDFYFATKESARHLHGFYTEFVEPVALCAGHSFLAQNTCDRANLTLGLGRFAAHVINVDFDRYFPALLGLPPPPTISLISR